MAKATNTTKTTRNTNKAAKGKAKATTTKRGRKTLEQLMTPAQMRTEVKGLMGELEAAKSTDEKKRLRRLLRRRGHTGGLGLRPITVQSINAD